MSAQPFPVDDMPPAGGPADADAVRMLKLNENEKARYDELKSSGTSPYKTDLGMRMHVIRMFRGDDEARNLGWALRDAMDRVSAASMAAEESRIRPARWDDYYVRTTPEMLSAKFSSGPKSRAETISWLNGRMDYAKKHGVDLDKVRRQNRFMVRRLAWNDVEPVYGNVPHHDFETWLSQVGDRYENPTRAEYEHSAFPTSMAKVTVGKDGWFQDKYGSDSLVRHEITPDGRAFVRRRPAYLVDLSDPEVRGNPEKYARRIVATDAWAKSQKFTRTPIYKWWSLYGRRGDGELNDILEALGKTTKNSVDEQLSEGTVVTRVDPVSEQTGSYRMVTPPGPALAKWRDRQKAKTAEKAKVVLSRYIGSKR